MDRAESRHAPLARRAAPEEAVVPAVAQGVLQLSESELRAAIHSGVLRELPDGRITERSIADYLSGGRA